MSSGFWTENPSDPSKNDSDSVSLHEAPDHDCEEVKGVWLGFVDGPPGPPMDHCVPSPSLWTRSRVFMCSRSSYLNLSRL